MPDQTRSLNDQRIIFTNEDYKIPHFVPSQNACEEFNISAIWKVIYKKNFIQMEF